VSSLFHQFFDQFSSLSLMARQIAFAGANGFPSAAYAPVMAALRSRGFAVRGHDCFPAMLPSVVAGRPDWREMRDMLLRSVEQQMQQDRRPIYGVGHSFGGAILCCAAARRPGLFEKLILVDPPMFEPTKRLASWTAACLGIEARHWHPYVKGALRRRRVWPSREAAKSYLRTRGVFANMSPDSLDAFVQHALQDGRPGTAADEGVELVFSPEAEAAIFATFPVDLPFVTPDSARVGQYDLDLVHDSTSASAGYFLYSTRHSLLSRSDVSVCA